MKRTLPVALMALIACHAFAGVNLITSRSSFTATDDLDWSTAGGELANVSSGTVVSTTGTPFQVKVTSDAGMTRYDEDSVWLGNFLPGEHLLANIDSNTGAIGSYMEVTGAKTCSDIGAQVQANFYGPFTAYVSAYNGLGQLIFSGSEAGVSNGVVDGSGSANGSAIFIGVHSDAGDIHSLDFSVVDQFGGNEFGMDHVSYRCCGAVPEPASMSVLALGALGLLRRCFVTGRMVRKTYGW